MSTARDVANDASPQTLAPAQQGLLEERLQAALDTTAGTPAITPLRGGGHAPLSFAQQRIWFLDQLLPNSPLYNMTVALRLEGVLEVGALEQAIAFVIARHEVLRTRFVCLDGEPWQEVFTPSPFKLATVDLTNIPAAEREPKLQGRLQEEARRPFNLSGDVLLRVLLFRLSDEEQVLFVNMHHIASDAASFDVFFQELGDAYGALVDGRTPQQPPLPIQYADYAAWQRQELDQASTQAHLAYWKEQLRGAPNLLELPTDNPRPSTPTWHGDRRIRAIPPGTALALQQLTRREAVTPFMLFLAAFQTLLYRLSRQEDILVGAPLAGRQQIETEGLIGFFINTLVLRSRFAEPLTFRELLRQLRATTLKAFSHQDLPFDKLVEELRPERAASHAPIIQVMFVYQNGGGEGFTLPGLRITTEQVGTGTAKFDLMLTITQSGEELSAELEYNTDLFEADTIERWLGHYERLLEGIAATPDQLVRDLPLLTDAERHRLLVEWNNTRTDYPRKACVHQLFEARAQERPDATAVIFGEARLSYGELNALANQLARHLQRGGVKPGMSVGLGVERSLEMVIGLLGILKAGAAYAALDPALPRDRLASMLEDLRLPMILTQDRWRSVFAEKTKGLTRAPAPRLICLDTDWNGVAGETTHNLPCDANPESLAYVSFTSGSTGRPKGVCVPHRAVVRLVQNTNFASFSPDEVFLQMAPLSFDASTLEIWGPLLNGGRLVVFPPLVPSMADLAEVIETHGVTTAWFTSGLFNQIVEEKIEVLRPLRQVLTGGDVLSPPHVRKALAGLKGIRLINGYGPTENTTFTACYTVPASFDGTRSVPIGRPIANTQCYVLDEGLQPAPIGVPGELYAGGDGLAASYLNRPELTAERFVPHPFEPGARLYKTGDQVRYLADGNLEFLGRTDLQVKIRGFRVELGEIESTLLRHPAVGQCAVVARSENSGTKQLVAYVVPEHTPGPADEQLHIFLHQHLPDYMVPQRFVTLRELPLSRNGKVDRHALPAPEFKAAAGGHAEARDEFERQLQRLWQQVLNVAPIGIRDKFFALGGHSLLAVRLLARVEKQFSKRLTVAALFQNPTIEQLARILREGRSPSPGSSIVEIQSSGAKPPLLLVHGAGGGMFWGYNNLARHLGPDQPLFAFKSRGLDGLEEYETVEELAEAYIQDLRVFQPKGPYYLGGYCFGGLIAYEMARRLHAQGESVGLLAFINTSVPNSDYTQFRWTPVSTLKFARNFLLRTVYSVLAHPEKLGGFFKWKARSLGQRLKQLVPVSHSETCRTPLSLDDWIDLSDYPEDQRRIWRTHLRAIARYHPQPYPGRVTLFRSPVHLLFCSFDPQYGWGRLAQRGVAVRLIPGAHETIMEEPRVSRLAAALSAALAEAKARGC